MPHTVRPRLVIAGIAVAGVALTLSFVLLKLDRRRREQERFESEVRAQCPGLIAWIEDRDVKVLDVAHLPGAAKARTFTFETRPRRVLFSTRGTLLFALVESPMTWTHSRIVALDLASGRQRTILDLQSAKLEGTAIDPENLFVTASGEAESENDRIVFRPEGTLSWYSVEALRERVRPVAGPPSGSRDQARMGSGNVRLAFLGGKAPGRLIVTDGKRAILVSEGRAAWPGAWCGR